MQLNTCGAEGCNPVEQTRGRMGPGDYADVIKSHRHVTPNPSNSLVDMVSSHDLHLIVERDESSQDDVRICCMTCGRVTGWQRRDAPGMPGVGVDFTRQQWNNWQRRDLPMPRETRS